MLRVAGCGLRVQRKGEDRVAGCGLRVEKHSHPQIKISLATVVLVIKFAVRHPQFLFYGHQDQSLRRSHSVTSWVQIQINLLLPLDILPMPSIPGRSLSDVCCNSASARK
jgi:hypothetical protein